MKKINNDFYNHLGDDWQTSSTHPVALLRAENRLRNPWIISHLPPSSKVLDLGCGAGFLSHALANAGHCVTGIDLSENSLEVARKFDSTKRVDYRFADATSLDLPSKSFDAVCAMDLLEHVENPHAVIQEASRLLKPGGFFFFHTFNRNFFSWLVVIKGVEWFVKNTPPDMHVYRLFIKPGEMSKMCQQEGLIVQQMRGANLKMLSSSFWRMLWTRKVSDNLEFVFSTSLKIGYSGFAKKT